MSTKNNANKVNKSEFIRSFPINASAADVVKAGKDKGLTFSPEYVHAIRWAAKNTKKNGGTTKTVERKASKPGASSSFNASSAYKLLAYAAEIGYGEAIRLIQTERDRIQKVLS